MVGQTTFGKRGIVLKNMERLQYKFQRIIKFLIKNYANKNLRLLQHQLIYRYGTISKSRRLKCCKRLKYNYAYVSDKRLKKKTQKKKKEIKITIKKRYDKTRSYLTRKTKIKSR